MELNRLTRATGPADDTGEAEYWISDVREFEDMLGFEILDWEHKPMAQFLYPSREKAEAARGAMFKVLADAVAITPAGDLLE
jgi:hypothetical protein